MVQSRHIDLEFVSARLGEISANKETSPRPSSNASTTTDIDPEQYYRYCLEKETEYHNTLVNEGGRPSHPISLGRDVAKSPGEYREILSFWQTSPNHPDDWMVFGAQMMLWREFRDHQRRMRQQGRFLAYHQALKDRLRRIGFERSFRLDEEPDRQDKLTNWAEFLNYEYWKYEKDADTIKRLQPLFDEAWKRLVDSKLLRSFETAEYVGGYTHGIQVISERSQARKAVESAKSTVQPAKKSFQQVPSASLSRGPFYQKKQKLPLAQSELAVAEMTLDTINRRISMVDNFHRQTSEYRSAKDRANSLGILLRWIQQQVSLVELKSNPEKVAENDSSRENGARRKRKRSRANDLNEERVSKRRRHDSDSNLVSDSRTRASTVQGRERQLKRSYHDSADGGQASKRPRYNGQTRNLSSHKTSDPADQTSIGEPLSIQSATPQDSGASAITNAKARSIRHPTLRVSKARSEAKEGKAWLRTRDEKVSVRRSTRIRKPPNRFQ